MAQRIQEQRVTLAAVEAERHLVQVGREMLCADLVPRSHDAALEQRECRFHRVSRDASTVLVSGIFLGVMVDGFVSVSTNSRFIGWQFVGDDYVHIGADILLDVLRQRALLGIFGMEESEIAIALTNADNDLFLDVLAPVFFEVALFSADIGFVHLDSAVKHRLIYFFHGGANAMTEIPRGLVAHSQGALDLIRGHSFASFAEQESCEEPFLQRQVGIVEDRAGGHAELIVAFFAVKELLCGRKFDSGHLATWAFNSAGPAQTDEQLSALLVGIEQVYNVN